MHIDWWTLALQTVNALVLIWILTRFFFHPVMNIIAKRQSG
jgi:F-type H+-transporting ATPase subunit b